MTTATQEDVFSTSPARGLADGGRIDREGLKIFGAKAIELGRVNDSRPWTVDRTTLEQVVSLVNAQSGGKKMRFGHLSGDEALGTTIGRASNARISGDGSNASVLVDVQLSRAAMKSPKGDLTSYLMDFASETPEDFGLSLHPKVDREAMAATPPTKDGLRPLRFKQIQSIDFVDDPAATRGGLFAKFEQELEDFLSSKGTNMTIEELTAANAAKDAEITTLKTQVADLSAKLEKMPKPTADDPKEKVKAELIRRSEVEALCKLAKIPDADRDLFLSAGFDRAEAQEILKLTGKLSTANPPVSEGGNDPNGTKETLDEKLAKEFDENADIFSRQGLTKEDYIKSRKLDTK